MTTETKKKLKADIKPLTIQRLLDIQPGRRIVYHIGKLPKDANGNRKTSMHANVVLRIWKCAQDLERRGLVELTEREIVRETAEGLSIRVTEYAAIGKVWSFFYAGSAH
jgi:hypothetical protein